MKTPSRTFRVAGVAALLISLCAVLVAPVSAQPGIPGEPGMDMEFETASPSFNAGVNTIYYPWVANDDDFGLGAADTSISVQNLEDRDAQMWIYVGDGSGGFELSTTAFLSRYASKTFTAEQLGIEEGTGAPVAVRAFHQTGPIDSEALIESVVLLSTPPSFEGAVEVQVSACVVNTVITENEEGGVTFAEPAPFAAAVDFTFGGQSYVAFDPDEEQDPEDYLVEWDDAEELQAILNSVNEGSEDFLVNPFGGLNNDADCNDTIVVEEGGASFLDSVAIGGVAKAAVGGASLPMTSEADTAVSGYNALSGWEVFRFDEWYLPIVQTNCGPGGCWDSTIRVANVGAVNNAVTIRFFPADDGSGSLHTGFQIQDLVNGGETWNVSLSDLVPEGWVGTAHIYSDGAVFAMVDRFKVGYNMWITNTGSSADFENLAQVENAQGDYVLFAPHVLVDYYGWNTGINVANLVNEDNNVSIQYFNLLGNSTQGLNQRLAGHGMTYFYDPSVAAQDNNNQEVDTDVTAGIVGSALIWSDFPVAAVVDATKYPETDPNGGADLFQATSYSATANVFNAQAVPLVQKGSTIDGMGSTSGINIMNPNPQAAVANVYWVNQSGFQGDNFGTSSVSIPGFANGFVYTMTQENLPNGFYGAAQVIASVPVVSVSANVDYLVDGDGSVIFNAYNPCGLYRTSQGDPGSDENVLCSFGDPFDTSGRSVTKTFTDELGDPIPGVGFSIVGQNPAFPFQRDGFSGIDGSATFTNVPVGEYELIVTSVPADFLLPDYEVEDPEMFTVNQGEDVTLFNTLDFAQGFTKTVCIGEFDEEAQEDFEGDLEEWEAAEPDPADFDTEEAFDEAFLEWLEAEPTIADFFPCSDTNLAGVQVVVYEVIGLDVELWPVVDLDPVFEGETGADGTVGGNLPSGDYILCIYRDQDVDITTAPGGEVLGELDLWPEVQNLHPCISDDPEDFDNELLSDLGDYFVVEPGVVTELENPVLLAEGMLNVFVYETAFILEGAALASHSDDEGVEGLTFCLDPNDPETCATSDENGTLSFLIEEIEDCCGSDANSVYLTLYLMESALQGAPQQGPACIVDADGGELTAEVDGWNCDSVGFDYSATLDVVQDGVMDDDHDTGTFDLEIGVGFEPLVD